MRAALQGLGDVARQVAGLLSRERMVTWALFDQFVVSAANFLTTVLVARALGVEEFGHFALSWSAVLFVQSLLSALVIFPMMSILPKLDEAGEETYTPAFLTLALIVSLGLSVVAVPAVLLILAAAISPAMLSLLVPMTLASIAMLGHEVLRRLAFAKGRPRLGTASDLVRFVGLAMVLLLVAAWLQIDAAWVFWLQAAAALAGVLTCLGIVPRSGYRWDELPGVARRHWVSAKWLLGSAGLSWITANWLAFAAGTFVGVSAVGGMRANETLTGLFNVFVQSLQNVVPVTAAKRLHERGVAGMVHYVNRASALLFAAGVLVAVVAASFAAQLFEIVFGAEFVEYSGLLFWFGLISAIVAVEVPVSAGLRALESTGAIFFAYLVSTVWMVVAGTAAIYFFGLAGVVAAYLITWVLRVAQAYYVLGRAAKQS